MSMMVSFVLSFFPRDVLDEILNLIESVSEDFPSYSYCLVSVDCTLSFVLRKSSRSIPAIHGSAATSQLWLRRQYGRQYFTKLQTGERFCVSDAKKMGKNACSLKPIREENTH